MEPHSDTKPLVSIIMPTYNRASFIRETVESIQQQTYPEWQLIIVDDGSDDNTRSIVESMADSRITYLWQLHCGIGGIIKNAGLKLAKGEFYAFIDSDDLWACDKLEKQVRLMCDFPSLGYCLVGGYNFRERGKPVEYFYPERSGVKKGKLFEDFFRSALPAFTQALMLRKTCCDKIGMFKEEKSFSDLDFILSVAYDFEGAILYEPRFFRRLHESNYINSTWENSYREGIAVIEDHFRHGKISKTLQEESLFNVYINFGEDCLLHNRRQKALEYFTKAWKLRPISTTAIKKIGKAFLA